jgi:hypothetical protein
MRLCAAFLILPLALASSCKKQEAGEMRKSRPLGGGAAPWTPLDAGSAGPDLVNVCQNLPEKKIGRGSLKGHFAGIQTGGDTRVLVRNEAGRLEAYHVPSLPMGYFLIAHRKEPLSLTYEVVDSCSPPAGGYLRISRLISVAARGKGHEEWWKDQEQDPARAEAARQAYERYVDGPFAP